MNNPVIVAVISVAIAGIIFIIGLLLQRRLYNTYKQIRSTLLKPQGLEEQIRVQEEEIQSLEEHIQSLKQLQIDPILHSSITAPDEAEKTQASEDIGANYLKAMLGERGNTHIQILGMSHPVDLADIYVQVRFRSGERVRYKIESGSLEAAEEQYPTAFLQSYQAVDEQHYSNADEPEKILPRATRLIIVGDPGTGKTSFLKLLTLRTARNEIHGMPNLPIYLELGAFAMSGMQDILEYSACLWQQLYNIPQQQAISYIKQHLQEGKVLLLLDALDETLIGPTAEEAEALYNRILTTIEDISARYPTSFIIVTSRIVNYHQRRPLLGFTELETIPFRSIDIEQFIKNWFTHSKSSYKREYADEHKERYTNQLKTAIGQNPNLRDLASNPLLLTLITQVFENGLELPGRRADLYKHCVETLLTRWDASRDIRRFRLLRSDDVRSLLQEVAWHTHNQGRGFLSEAELLDLTAEFLPKLPTIAGSARNSLQIVHEITADYGLLKERANGFYSFLHLTLQEYLASRYALDHDQEGATLTHLLKHRSEIWWKEVILLYVGQSRDASPLLKRLLDMNEQQRKEEDLILAGSCLADRPIIRNVRLREETINRLLNMLQQTKNDSLQIKTAITLTYIGGTNLKSTLVDLLQDPHVGIEIQQCIIQAMTQQGNDYYRQDLIFLVENNRLQGVLYNQVQQALAIMSGHEE